MGHAHKSTLPGAAFFSLKGNSLEELPGFDTVTMSSDRWCLHTRALSENHTGTADDLQVSDCWVHREKRREVSIGLSVCAPTVFGPQAFKCLSLF